jgi:hypothetical protein
MWKQDAILHPHISSYSPTDENRRRKSCDNLYCEMPELLIDVLGISFIEQFLNGEELANSHSGKIRKGMCLAMIPNRMGC